MNAPTAADESSALASLPPDVLRRTLSLLTLADRSTLRRCSRGLRLSVLALDQSLLPPEQPDGGSSPRAGREEAEGTGGDDFARAQASLRREMIDAVEGRRWLARSRRLQPREGPALSSSDPPGEPAPGPSHLRRLIRGDFLADPIDFDGYFGREYASDDDSASSCRKYRYQRQNRYYSSAELIDGHIWVLFNDYWDSFEAFDLDTGRALESAHCCGGVGPDKDYVNDEEERIGLYLECFAGAHGLLAQGLELRGGRGNNPHGAWSGPYLTVWELGSGEVRMCVDLCRPLCRIVEVRVVARDKVAVVLQGTEGVELQWHRIPGDRTEMGYVHGSQLPIPEPDRPGEKPPDHRCSGECPFDGGCPHRLRLVVWHGQTDFWQEQQEGPKEKRKWDDYSRNDNDKEAPVFSYEVRARYPWWPGKRSLLQSAQLQAGPLKGYNNATMQCDSGMLVIVVGNSVQVWHVGTMSLLRDCAPFEHPGINVFHEGIYVDSLSVKTVIFPIKDALGPGEGQYYAPANDGHYRDAPYPDPMTSAQCTGSKNPIDLAHCDADAILARFAHLTHDEQRNFEKGDCGLGRDGPFRRSKVVEEGSCTPQLECIVRVAFGMHNMGTGMNNVVNVDINPFFHMRHRERDEWGDEELLEKNLTNYERACFGHGLPSSSDTLYCDLQTGQCITVLDWERGGIFDFEEAPSTDDRQKKSSALFEKYYDTDKKEYEKLAKLEAEVEKEMEKSRCVTSIHIDSHKLIVCTPFEVTVLPFSLFLRKRFGKDKSLPEDWRELETEQDRYLCRKETKVWHSYRPSDVLLVKLWSKLRRTASHDCDMPAASNKQWELESIAADFSENLGKELALLTAASYEVPRLSCHCLSWRYLAFLNSSSEYEGHENLNVYDSIADLVREGGTRLEARAGDVRESAAMEPGVYFELDDSSSDEE